MAQLFESKIEVRFLKTGKMDSDDLDFFKQLPKVVVHLMITRRRTNELGFNASV
jgi:hypothetical protein